MKYQSQLVKKGVTSYCPTLITSSKETYKKILPKIKRNVGGKENGATILGVHLEGPFISALRKGAHPINLIQDKLKLDSIEQLKECYGSLDNVSIITLAPEICNPKIYNQLKQLGITASMGHTNASLEEANLALKNNCNLITHLFNAMPQFHHRNPSVIGCLTSSLNDSKLNDYDLNNNNLLNGNFENSDDEENGSQRQLYYGVICDNVHTHETALRLAYRLNPNGFICVS